MSSSSGSYPSPTTRRLIASESTRSRGPEERVALVDAPTGDRFTFAALDRASGRLANALTDIGIGVGDRVGVVAPQRPVVPIVHLALWKLGGVPIPLPVQFGRDALAFLEQPDVEQARVVGVSDETRGEIVKAFVEPTAGATPGERLRESLQDTVRSRLGTIYEHADGVGTEISLR